MNEAQGANPPNPSNPPNSPNNPPGSGQPTAQPSSQPVISRPERPSLLSYWAAAAPSDAKWFRIAFFQPFFGILFVIAGLVLIALAVLIWHSIAWGVVGGVLLVLGGVMAGTSYWISVIYFHEYPGGFGAYLEEYVARRVSRLVRNDFIPRYRPQNSEDIQKIRVMNGQVSLAVQAELLRLEQSEHAGAPEICGVLVVGPKHSNKTGALWDAMKLHLREWTFVRWPHHMDYPPDLASHLGHRIVLWLDDLHDFANLGEAAALDQFIQQLSVEPRRFLVLASCRNEQDEQETKRYFRPLINRLRHVRAPTSLTPGSKSRELRKQFDDLPESRKSVLETVDWLESQQVNTFPWEALAVLSNEFQPTGAERDSDEETLQGLANDSTNRFVQVNQRADPRVHLEEERYDFWRWFRYTFYPKRYTRRRRKNQSEDVHYVFEPINVNNLDLESSRDVRTEKTTSMLKEMADTLEQHPESLIRRLSNSPFAAETLILLGDEYLYRQEENLEKAGELAVLCYNGALAALVQDNFATHFPGAWAAAHIGKGNAALRARKLSDDPKQRAKKLSEADIVYGAVTKRATLPLVDGARSIPRMAIAHAWHGQGDAIAANIPSEVATQSSGSGAPSEFVQAANYFANAAAAFPPGDPLQNEARLDRANVLYVIARLESKWFQDSLSNTTYSDTPISPPKDAIGAAETACLEAQVWYGKEAAPAVWAELQRRLGDLCMIRTHWLVPADKRAPLLGFSEAARNLLGSSADESAALKMANAARDYFTKACDVFAPSYLLMSWLDAQVGLIRAQLITARLVASDASDAARDLYQLSFSMIDTGLEQVARLGHSPLDWVDLQLLQAQGEIGNGLLSKNDSEKAFPKAAGILDDIKRFLGSFTPLRAGIASSRTAAQLAMVDALSAEIERAKLR